MSEEIRKMKNTSGFAISIVVLFVVTFTPACNQAETILKQAEADGVAADASGGINWFRNVYEAKSAASERDVIMMVDVYTDWCHWCKELDKKVFTDSQVIALSRDMVNLKVDAEDDGEGTRLARKYGVQGFPTILFLTADGQEIDRIGGYLPADAFAEEIERIKSGRGTWMSLQKAVDKGDLTPDERVDVAVKLMRRNKAEALDKVLTGLKPSAVVDPETREQAYLILTDYSFFKGNYSQAEKYLLDYASKYPQSENTAKVHMLLVITKVQQNDESGARTYLDQLKNRFPQEDKLIAQAEEYLSRLEQ
jgi:thioredoxin-related protein